MAIFMTGDIQKKGVLFMFGGSRVLKMVPEVIINMGGNKKLVIGTIHESRCLSDTLVPPLTLKISTSYVTC